MADPLDSDVPPRRREPATAIAEHLATVGHELRGPLGAIIALSEMMAGEAEGEGQRRRAGLLRLAASHLAAVADDLVDESAIRSGRVRTAATTLDPAALVEDLADLFGPLVGDRPLSIRAEVAPGLPPAVRADGQRIRQILINLLNNAVRYTADGAVVVRARRAGENLVAFEVEDTGPGTGMRRPTDDVRADGSGPHPGAGLGLDIARRLAAAIGGELSIGIAPSGGTNALLTVPARMERPRRRAEDRAEEERAAAPSLPSPGAPSPLAGRQALVVDDSAVGRALLTTLLDGFGMTASSAASSVEALARVLGQGPDVVLLDIALAGTDGNDTARRLKSLLGPACPVLVAVTAAPENAERSLFTAVLPKPFSASALYAVLSPLLMRPKAEV